MLMPVQHDSLPDDVEYSSTSRTMYKYSFSVNLFNKLTLFLMLNV